MVLVLLILQLLHDFFYFKWQVRRYDYIKFGKNIITFDHKIE